MARRHRAWCLAVMLHVVSLRHIMIFMAQQAAEKPSLHNGRAARILWNFQNLLEFRMSHLLLAYYSTSTAQTVTAVKICRR